MPAVLEARPPSVAVRPSAATPAAPVAAREPTAESGAAPAPDGERPDALAAEVARAVRDLRAGSGLSERAAARLLGTSQTQLRRMEDPRYLPSLRSLARVAAAYGRRLRIAFEPRDRVQVKPAQRPPARPRPSPAPVKRPSGGRPKVRGRRRP